MRISLTILAAGLLLAMGLPSAALGQELDKKTIKVTASAWESKAHGGFADFPPEATLDGNLSAASSWRADGNGQWIQYDLGAARRLGEIKIALVAGNARQYTLDILVSKTGAEKEWTTAVDRATSGGKTADYESFKLNGAEARYVRIVGHGNNSEKFPNWINITEVSIIEAGAATKEPAATAPAAATPAPAMKKVLYAKPFSDEMMKEWVTVSGKWTVAVEDKKACLHADPAGIMRVVFGDKTWADYAVEVRGRVDKWTSDKLGDYGIVARYADPNNYYLFLYDSNPNVKGLIIQKKVAGKLTTLAQQPFEYKTGQWYTLKGVVAGEQLEFYVDGKKMLSATATDFKSGPAGLLVWLAETQLEGFGVTGPGE
jgi:hypothetical protein